MVKHEHSVSVYDTEMVIDIQSLISLTTKIKKYL